MTSSFNDNVEVQDLNNQDMEDDKLSSPEEDVEQQSKRKRKKKAQATSSDRSKTTMLRKNRSKYWDYFQKISDNPPIAACKYCNSELGCASKNGTAPLSNHIKRCMKFPANLDRMQKLIDLETKTIKNDDGTTQSYTFPKLWEFDYDLCRKALAKMIIVDELPFIFVEHEGFREYSKALNPQFAIPSRTTITRDCYKLFLEKRNELKDVFKNLKSKICLTTDCWTSSQNLGYMCLTAHFIDDDWVLHKRIINFCPIPGHSGQIIGRSVEKCLIEWGLKNILTVTVDNASSNDLAIDYLRRRLNIWESSVLDGVYLHMRCAAHILNLIVREGLKELDLSIIKIRALVRYVRSSPARLLKFKECIKEERLESKSLVCLDVETRWNSTFLMLESASKFKKAFECLLMKDSMCYKELRKIGGGPSEDDWKRVGSLLPFLNIFYDATLRLSGSRYVTCNSYVHEIYGTSLLIKSNLQDGDEGIKNMAKNMKSKYEKYYGNVENINVLVFVALILDPRHKMTYVEWMVKDNYEPTKANLLISKIKLVLDNLFESYAYSISQPKKNQASSSASTSTTSTFTQDVDSTRTRGERKNIDLEAIMTSKFQRDTGCDDTSDTKSELEKYLDDVKEPKSSNFDILTWWKDQQKRYPILNKMAKDVLAIPVSTVASESAFSMGGRVLDDFRTSLTPKMVEALVCAKDWLRSSTTPLVIEEHLKMLEEMEEGLKDLTMEQPEIIIDETIDTME